MRLGEAWKKWLASQPRRPYNCVVVRMRTLCATTGQPAKQGPEGDASEGQ